MTPEEKISSLNLSIPKGKSASLGSYIPITKVENLIFISGQIPVNMESSNNELKYKGKVGRQISIEEAQEAGKICCLNALSHLKNLIGELDKIKKIVKITGYVNSDEDFMEHPKVINGASDLLLNIFGEKGKHTRVAIGVNSLPLGSPIEIDFIIQI
ncbi:MAG: RidA family protein [Nitrosopumilus sp.]|nr:RidA family protein [Nitrosopumilus sp.]